MFPYAMMLNKLNAQNPIVWKAGRPANTKDMATNKILLKRSHGTIKILNLSLEYRLTLRYSSSYCFLMFSFLNLLKLWCKNRIIEHGIKQRNTSIDIPPPKF